MRAREFLLTAFAALVAMSANAQVEKVYMNPVQSAVSMDSNKKNRLQTKLIMGMSKAHTLKTTKGQTLTANGKLASDGYKYALNVNVTEASHKQDEELFSSKKKDTYTATVKMNVALVDVTNGKEVASSLFECSASNKDINTAYYKAFNTVDEDIIDFIDNSLPVTAEMIEIYESNVDKEDAEAKAVKVNKGAAAGVRRDMMFTVYKEVNGDRQEIGKARCEQVLSADESLLKVYGKEDGDKTVAELFKNMDGSFNVVFVSRSKKLWGKLGSSLTKVFKKDERTNYYEPDLDRQAKLKVGLMGINAANSSVTKEALELLASETVEGLSKVTTIDFVKQLHPTLEAAQKAGLDGLINITFDKLDQTTSKTKEGKTKYESHAYISIEGINVHDGSWIEMTDADQPHSSLENAAEAVKKAVDAMDDHIKKFAEDVFPVAGKVMEIKEAKDYVDKKSKKKKAEEDNAQPAKQRGSVKVASISIGSNVGVRKNMMFDIYKQIKGVGADSRVFLGTGKVSENPSATEAVIKIKGSKKGDEVIYDILKNATDDSIEIIVISRAFDGLGGFLDRLL